MDTLDELPIKITTCVHCISCGREWLTDGTLTMIEIVLDDTIKCRSCGSRALEVTTMAEEK